MCSAEQQRSEASSASRRIVLHFVNSSVSLSEEPEDLALKEAACSGRHDSQSEASRTKVELSYV